MTEALRTYLLYELRRIQAEIPRTPIGAISTSSGLTAAGLTDHLFAVIAAWNDDTVVPEWFLEMERQN